MTNETVMGVKTAHPSATERGKPVLVGTFHRFGKHGVAYEIIGIENTREATIRVVETGEVLRYPIEHILRDPAA